MLLAGLPAGDLCFRMKSTSLEFGIGHGGVCSGTLMPLLGVVGRGVVNGGLATSGGLKFGFEHNKN